MIGPESLQRILNQQQDLAAGNIYSGHCEYWLQSALGAAQQQQGVNLQAQVKRIAQR